MLGLHASLLHRAAVGLHHAGALHHAVGERGGGIADVDLAAADVERTAVECGLTLRPKRSDEPSLKPNIAVVGGKRFAGLPELPTFAELGYKKLNIDFWHMLLAPARTPRPIIDKLNSALRVALADAKLRKTYNDGGMDLYPQDEETPEAASTLLKREIKLWGDVIRANHIATQ